VTHLRKRMLEELQRRNYSEITTRKYLWVVTDFAKHFGKSPDKLGPTELRIRRNKRPCILASRSAARPIPWRRAGLDFPPPEFPKPSRPRQEHRIRQLRFRRWL
jgi:Phage integrase, N-terminal SAM-like domain